MIRCIQHGTCDGDTITHKIAGSRQRQFSPSKLWPPESPKKFGYVLDPKVLCCFSHIHFLIRLCASLIYVKQRYTVTPSDVLQCMLSKGISLPVPVVTRSKP